MYNNYNKNLGLLCIIFYTNYRDTLAYESNYCAGLRILDVSKMEEKDGIKEVGFFEVAPNFKGKLEFQGAWSSYVYFDSETIIVNRYVYMYNNLLLLV